MTQDCALEMARAAGFSHWGIFPVSEMKFLPEVRAACEVNKCGRYDRSWSCPPACGDLGECAERAAAFDWGILLQTTAEMEDDFDVETMFDAERLQKERFDAFCGSIGKEESCLPLGAGSCTLCGECSYPDAPCRFPDRMHASMEAFGLLVTDVCKAADTPYYYGPRTITYTCCVLFENE